MSYEMLGSAKCLDTQANRILTLGFAQPHSSFVFRNFGLTFFSSYDILHLSHKRIAHCERMHIYLW